jgi:uncharacterized protein YutE (UPF0331/DUF86 family)
MSRFNLNTIAHKIERMIARIDRLNDFQGCTLEKYLSDEDYTQVIIERLLELVIQSSLDINNTMLKQVAGINFVTNAESFNEAGNAGFIPIDLARQLEPFGRFRNALAHQYDEINPADVFQNFQEALIYYPDYVEAIQNYLDCLEDTSDE